jgi:hypothetical protein
MARVSSRTSGFSLLKKRRQHRDDDEEENEKKAKGEW